MAGPPSGDYAQLSFLMSGIALPNGAVVTLGLKTDAPPWGVDDLNLIKTFSTALHQEMSHMNVRLDTLELKVGPNDTGPTFSTSVGVAGNGTGSAAPPNTCSLTRKQVAGVSNRFAGRMFYPGVVEAQVDDAGIVSPTLMGFYQTALTTFLTSMNDAGFHPVVFSTKPEFSTPHTVVALTAQNRVATQRRRLRR